MSRPSTRMLLAALCLLLSPSLTAAVRTMLEPRLVDEMETVRLTLRVDGASQLDAPDFSPLEKDFELLGTQSSSRISSINGRTSAVLEYQINLRPRRTGQIVLPRLKLGDDYSEALELAVRPLDPQVRESIERMIFFETGFTANPVYVQAQTVLERRLYYSNGVQIYSDLPGVPEIANAVVVPLGETRSSTTVRDGRRYGVIEQRFAIFPEQSGTLEIPSISVTSSIRLQAQGRTRRSGIRVSTEALTLEVLPIPERYPADVPWLPAESVTLEESWDPDRARFDIGEPLRLTLDALVVGNVASAVPPTGLALPADSFKVYPEAPELSEDNAGTSIVGRRRESYALIPTAPGRIQVPEQGIVWWDTINDQLQRTRLPARTFQVTGTALAAPAEEPQAAAPADPEAPPLSVAVTPLISPWLLAGAVTLLLMVAAAIWLALRVRQRHPRRAARPAGRGQRRAALKALETAAHGNDPRRLRHALETFLAEHWRCTPQAARRRFRADPRAAAALRSLDRAIYDAGADPAAADGEELLTLAKAAAAASTERTPGNGLPALYG